MENEKYGIQLTAETSQFKESIKELSNLVKTFREEIEKDINISPEVKMSKDKMFEKFIDKTANAEVFEETKRYTQLSRLIQKAEDSVSSYNAKINQLQQDMEELSVASEKAFQTAEQLKAFDFKAEQGGSFDVAEGIMYAQLDKDRNKIEKDEQKYYDAMEKNQQKMNELIQQRIIAEQQLNALQEKRKQEAMSNTTQQELENIKDKYENLKKSGHGAGISLEGMFKKSINSIKRFSLMLLGARTALGMFMKYQSIYYQYNEKMRYQTELSQNAIALSLAPAFEFLGNVISYASIAFARFIQLLTGVNVLTKVSTKGIRDYNKSLKESQSLLAGIDEITNLTLPSGTGLGSQYQALKDFQDMVKSFDEWWSKFKKGFLDWLDPTEAINEIKDKGLLKTITDLLDGQLSNVYNQVFKEHVDKIIEKLKTDLKPIWDPIKTSLEQIIEKMKPVWNKFLNPLKEKYNEVKEEMLRQMSPYLNTLIDIWNNTFGWLFGKIDYLDYTTSTFLADLTTEQKKTLQEMGIDVDTYTTNSEKDIDKIKSKFKGLTDDQKKKLKEVGIDIDAVATTGNKDIDSVQENIEDIGKMNVEFTMDADTSKANSTLTNFFSKLGINLGNGKLSTTIGLTFKSVGENISKGITNFADVVKSFFPHEAGLDYVPYDNYPALLHKGEAVVPAKYNPQIHGVGNEYTNVLLETMIVKLDELSRRPNEFNIDGRQFAEATYPLYEEAKQRQNYVEGVVR